jgi:endonuclease/exonuclease/phosphatase family metal-dependent hydrolase
MTWTEGSVIGPTAAKSIDDKNKNSDVMIELIRVTTYNIHKGLSSLNRRMVVHELRERLSAIGADVVFLQEVLGEHEQNAQRFLNWPSEPQHEFIAGEEWVDFAYGKNAIYEGGHHGNAILSRFPIARWDNEDISAHRLESRGLLHCEIEVPGWRQPLHCVNVHLGLAARWRWRQLEALRKRIERLVPQDAPLVIAGDFNDWRRHASLELIAGLKVQEAFEAYRGRPARSFPSALPVFSLDRIYVRGFRVRHARVHHGNVWAKLSDHAALSATLVKL